MIYQVTIPNFENLRDEAIDRVRDRISGICDWKFYPFSEGSEVLELVSGRITKIQLDLVTEQLRLAAVQYSVQDFSPEYVHAVTNAPPEYDYPGTSIFLFSSGEDDRGRPERHLAIRKSHLEFQLGRNSSGLFQTRIIK